MKHRNQKAVALVLCLLMLPAAALASSEEAERMAELEARVAELEAQMETLLADQMLETEMEIIPFEMGIALTLEEGRVLTVSSFENSSHFRYSPTNGFTVQSLSTSSGYQLLLLHVNVENNRDEALQVSKLVTATLFYGEDYTHQAHANFYYLNNRGSFSGGMRAINPQSTVDGCLLFALPDAQDDTEPLSVQFTYNDTIYECKLR